MNNSGFTNTKFIDIFISQYVDYLTNIILENENENAAERLKKANIIKLAYQRGHISHQEAIKQLLVI